MKKIFSFASIVCMFAMLASCNEDPTYYQVPDVSGSMNLNLTCSQERIQLDKSTSDATAVTFNWDAVKSPLSANDSVAYFLRFYDPASKTEHISDTIPMGSATTKSFTHNELNNIVSRWIHPDVPIEVTAQLLCYVFNEQKFVKPVVSEAKFWVTCYEKFPTYLYLRITDNATGSTKTERLEQVETGSGIYQYTAPLTPSTFVFGTSATDEYPVYALESGEKMKYVTSGDYQSFSTTASGERTMIIDLNDGYTDCRIVEMIKLPRPGHIWIVGDGCSVGWNPNNSAGLFEMVGGLREPWIYAWTGEFHSAKDGSEGMFKIGLESDYGGQFFFAPSNGANPMTDLGIDGPRTQGGSDNKWQVPAEGEGVHTLKLILLADDLHLEFE